MSHVALNIGKRLILTLVVTILVLLDIGQLRALDLVSLGLT